MTAIFSPVVRWFETWRGKILEEEVERQSALPQYLQWFGSWSKWMNVCFELVVSGPHAPQFLLSRWFIHVTLALYKHLWDWLSNGAYSSHSESNWVDSCNSSELYSALSEWMKGVVDASSPHSPLGGLGRKDETRAPTKPLGDYRVIDSQCRGLIFAGSDGSHCELSVCVLHAHKNWRNELQKDRL